MTPAEGAGAPEGRPARVPAGALLRGPANFLALGAGSGLAPKAPGTFGTLVGIPVLFLMPQASAGYAVLVIALFALGVWCCDACARDLGVHDHPAIVFDEVVGYLVTMFAAPRSLGFVVLGFALFRCFDILKPWPIGPVDRRVGGGFGIMADDVLAGVFAAACLHLVARALG